MSSAGGQSEEESKSPWVTVTAKTAAGGTRLGLGQRLSDQACQAALETTGLFIHLHLAGTAEEQILLSVYGTR